MVTGGFLIFVGLFYWVISLSAPPGILDGSEKNDEPSKS
jgi:hypothetical protein